MVNKITIYVALVIVGVWFRLVQNQKFVVGGPKLKFDEANNFCKNKYQDGGLAIIKDSKSQSKIRRLLYDDVIDSGKLLFNHSKN